MSITLGDGDFIITADSSDFERARADIFGVMRRVDQRADQTANLIDRRFTESAQEISRQFDVLGVSMERSITRATENISDEVRQMGNDIERSVSNAAAGLAEEFGRELAELRLDSQRTEQAVSNDADNMGDAIAREIARGVALANAALLLLSDGSNRALGSVTRLVGGFSKMTVAVGALSTAFAGLVNIVAAAATSIEQLAGVMLVAPTAIVALVGIIGTLKVALNGVGEAIGAGISGDTEKFEEALKKLSPAAQEAIRGLDGVFDRMRNLRTVVQDSFFNEINDSLGAFGRTAVGIAERVMPRLAASLGVVADEFLRTARSSTFLSGIEEILGRTARGVQSLGGPVSNLTSAFGDLFVVGAEYVDRFYASLGRTIDRFSDWIRVSADNGNLKKWIDEALAGFAQIGRILRNLGQIFGTLNSQATTAGTGILGILEKVTGTLRDALRSDVGQSFLVSSFNLLGEVMRTFGILLGPVVSLLARLATIINNELSRAVTALAPYVERFAGWLEKVGKAATQANPEISSLATGAVGFLADRFKVLQEAIAPIGEAVAGTGDRIKSAFSGVGTDTLDAIIRAVGSLGVALAGVGSDVLVSLSRVFSELIQLSPRIIGLFERFATVVGNVVSGSLDALVPLLEPLLRIFEKLAPVMDLAGTAVVTLVRGASDLAVALAPLAEAIADVAGNLADDLNPALQEMSDGFSRNVTPAIEKASQSLGDKLSAGFERLQPSLRGFGEGFRSLAEPAGRLVESAGRLFAALGPLTSVMAELGTVIYEKLIPPVFALFRAILTVFSVMADKLAPIVRAVAEVLGEALAEAAEKLAPIFADMSEKVQTAIQQIEEKGGPVLRVLENLLAVVLPIALEVLRVAVGAAFDTIIFVIQTAWEVISGVLETLALFLSGDFSAAWDRLKETISGVWDSIADYIIATIGRLVDFVTNTGMVDLVEAVGQGFRNAYNEVVSWLDAAYDEVASWVAGVLRWFSALPGLIGRAFTGAIDWLFNFGRDIVTGLLNGIADKASSIGNFIEDKIVNPIKKALGGAAGFLFGSPSKVTTQYGKWIADGLAIGIESAEGAVVAAAESLTAAAALPGMSPGSSAMGVTGGRSPFVPNVVPVTAGSGATFGPGAVQVVFQGVVPTEAEAFATGRAVGSGIADVIARRDARVSVGVL